MPPLTASNVRDRGGDAVHSTSTPARATLIGSIFLLWALFFAICLGLGYPTLNRYQPNHIDGLTDSAIYYRMVINAPSSRPRVEIFEARVLVPFVARPFYRLANGRIQSWDPVYFGLLISNSIFCATTVLLLLAAGLVVTRDTGTALVAALLYLLNFAVPNMQLAGLVDSGEACFMMMLVFALLTKRWWLLPFVGVGGALAKETFIVFAAVFATVWWLRTARPLVFRSREFYYLLALIGCSEVTAMAVNFANLGRLVTPWHIWSAMAAHPNYLQAFFRCLSGRSFWYVFIWLLPLGVWGSKRLPREWVTAALVTGLVGLVLGTSNDMGGTIGRPIFNVAGTGLALGVAILLIRLARKIGHGKLIFASDNG